MDCGEHVCSSEDAQVDPAFLEGLLQKNGYDHEALIMILQDITAKYNHLPKEALTYISQRLNVSISQIYSVATFYKVFSLTPRGKYIVKVCLGTACHVRGADKIMESIEQRLAIREGNTTKDLKFTLESVRCLGCCALGPVITVNDRYHGGLDREKAIKVIEEYERKA
jgi:NADH:ubiquinone oxidoreductase subunit E